MARKTQRGRPRIAQRTRQVNVTMPAPLMARIERYAASEFMTRQEAVRDLLAGALSARSGKGGSR